MRIAVVGSGISGLVCAWLLQRNHEVTVFEAGSHIGGHTNTVPVALGGRTWSVDTGFIVFNPLNYPNFCRILDQLGVDSQESDMGFSVRCHSTGLEWNGKDLRRIFVQKRNLLRPRFLAMVRDILRFNKLAKAVADAGESTETLGSFCQRHHLGLWFQQYYIVPMASAIWSMPPVDIMNFPLLTMARFMDQHRMLTVDDRPQWRTVSGGSWSYVRAMTADFRDRIHTNTPVRTIRRSEDGIHIATDSDEARFDHVIMACHSDQALALLKDPSEAEQAVLGAIRYQANEATLHTDDSLMPQRKGAWAAWNAHVDPSKLEQPASLTYNMNILQGLHAPKQFLVTLGGAIDIAEDQVIRRIRYHHPLFTNAAIAAQGQHDQISGQRNTHYCGAYWGFGFHEDGVVSALRVCKHFGEALP
ncbi:MAG: FAD-dependent oxidoreductase [Planctomycetota bacterium]|nr:FAD-dependent oxidoreductase [Planctomycetota bacterium]